MAKYCHAVFWGLNRVYVPHNRLEEDTGASQVGLILGENDVSFLTDWHVTLPRKEEMGQITLGGLQLGLKLLTCICETGVSLGGSPTLMLVALKWCSSLCLCLTPI